MNDSAKDRLLDDLADLIEEVEELLDHGVDATGDAVQQAKSAARDKLRGAKDRLMKFEKGVVKDTNRYVRDNPWGMLGVTAAVAFLLGYLAHGRPHEHD